MKNITLPQNSWTFHEKLLKDIGERKKIKQSPGITFLRVLGFLDETNKLTTLGNDYFLNHFILNNQPKSQEILSNAVLEYPPAAAICQLLEGIPNVSRNTVESLLRNQGFDEMLNSSTLGSLLSLMEKAQLIQYIKSNSSVTILIRMSQTEKVPSNIFISPETPYSNKIWLRKILEDCEDYIYWVDKHFLPIALETLYEAVQGDEIKLIRILSLNLSENYGKHGKKQYLDLKTELANRKINLEWNTIDSKLIRDLHDRWIIDSRNARNVPDVGTIFSGNHSEISLSSRQPALKKIFEGYWAKSTPLR